MDQSPLFSGQLHPRLQAAAPRLVHLRTASPATFELLRRGWGKSWGILTITAAGITLEQQRLHLKKFLRVKTEQGQTLMFRYYDPRVSRLRQNPLKRSTLLLSSLKPQQAGNRIYVAHLSDLHIPCGTRLTEDEPWEDDILQKCSNTLAAKDKEQPLAAIVFSGDITDTGRPGAWQTFESSFGAYKDRIVMAPGNHDLNIVGYGALSILLVRDKSGAEGRWTRMEAFMKTAIVMMGDRAQVWQDGKLVPLTDAWERVLNCKPNLRKALQFANDLFPLVVTVSEDQALTFIV
nr:DUF4123 domain-containing protein [Duganella vulcania]